MATSNIVLFERLEQNIIENIQSIKRLVEEAQALQTTLNELPEEKRAEVQKHINAITSIINQLTQQTLEMFSTFKKLVE